MLDNARLFSLLSSGRTFVVFDPSEEPETGRAAFRVRYDQDPEIAVVAGSNPDGSGVRFLYVGPVPEPEPDSSSGPRPYPVRRFPAARDPGPEISESPQLSMF